jgi:hypothetical protein
MEEKNEMKTDIISVTDQRTATQRHLSLHSLRSISRRFLLLMAVVSCEEGSGESCKLIS